MKQYYIYIISNNNANVLYIGITSDLLKRIYQHKNKTIKGFSAKYNLTKLLYYEACNDVYVAISREKQLKNWHKDWKLNLIKSNNPYLSDLYPKLM